MPRARSGRSSARHPKRTRDTWSLRRAKRPCRTRRSRSRPDDIHGNESRLQAEHAMKDMLVQVEPLIPALRRYARSLVRNRAAADDLVQDCLERAVSRWHQRRDGNVRAWLFTILHNLAVSQFRQASARGRHVPIDATNEDNFAE